MKRHSLLFQAPSVRSMLAGDKTATRRKMKVQPPEGSIPEMQLRFTPGELVYVKEDYRTYVSLDHLKPTEIWSADQERGAGFAYYAGGGMAITRGKGKREYLFDDEREDLEAFGIKRQGLFMPAAFSRITLRIIDVKSERLKDITDEGAILEGATMRPKTNGVGNQFDGWCMDWSRIGKISPAAKKGGKLTASDISLNSPRAAYLSYWNEINGHGSSVSNPWVWVYTFDVIKQNITQLEQA